MDYDQDGVSRWEADGLFYASYRSNTFITSMRLSDADVKGYYFTPGVHPVLKRAARTDDAGSREGS
jgi:hypothetical protein